MTQPQANEHQYFIIGGGGRVGYFLTKALLEAGHEVVLLDKDAARVMALNRELGEGSEAVVERGDACEVSTLDHVGAERADYLLAVTGEDEDNLVMCQMAQTGFTRTNGKTCRTIARVNNVANIGLFHKLGIDVIVSPTQNILEAIGTELPLPQIAQLAPASNDGLQLIEVRVAADAPARGKTIESLGWANGNTPTLLIRGTQNYAPEKHLALQPGDKLFAVVTPEGRVALKRALLGGMAKH
jgi:trk system potassium uptake protein